MEGHGNVTGKSRSRRQAPRPSAADAAEAAAERHPGAGLLGGSSVRRCGLNVDVTNKHASSTRRAAAALSRTVARSSAGLCSGRHSPGAAAVRRRPIQP